MTNDALTSRRVVRHVADRPDQLHAQLGQGGRRRLRRQGHPLRVGGRPDPRGVEVRSSPTPSTPRDEIPDELLDHLRYPEDMFKVQRYILAQYHVTAPQDFYRGTDRWEVPEDPADDGEHAAALPAVGADAGGAGGSRRRRASSRAGVRTPPSSTGTPVFSLTSVYTPDEPVRTWLVHRGELRRDQRGLRRRSGSCGCRTPPRSRARRRSRTRSRPTRRIQGAPAADQAELADPLRQPADAAGGRRAALRAAGLRAAGERGGCLPGAAVRARLLRSQRRLRHVADRGAQRRPARHR